MREINELIDRVRQYRPRTLCFDYREAAVLVAVTRSSSPEIVFTRRSQALATHAGQVAFPGGKKEDIDKNLLATALRESREEIGLHARDVEIVGPLSQVVSRFGILVTPYVGLIDPSLQLVACESELESIFKVPVNFFLSEKPARVDLLSFKQYVLHVPCFQYQQYEIWGMSSIIMVDFLNVAYDAEISLFA
ncbi:MAG: coenzyme A pyrophosphatase [Gammaproteobacteria bacterium]|nr:MAG: coenzyme A pyrophosphatase [Gammaproteobacteria bacterium]